MKLSDATTIRKLKAAIQTKDVSITTTEHGNKITGFRVVLGKTPEKVFSVKGGDILKAWKEVERYCKDLK